MMGDNRNDSLIGEVSMTERLRRVHALLRAGNVPSALSSQPGLGTVLLAGTPNQGPWEVVAYEAGDGMRISHDGETVQLPAEWADMTIANAIKLRVVQAWADQGDPDARAVLARLGNSSQQPRSQQPQWQYDEYPEYASVVSMQFVNPLQLAADMFQAVSRMGWDLFNTRAPIRTSFTVPSPWGVFRTTTLRPPRQ
jgi:hypothetical protein